jgi:hypothetical protein
MGIIVFGLPEAAPSPTGLAFTEGHILKKN